MAITISYPQNGAPSVTGTITVTATVSGSTNGLSASSLYVDGAFKAAGTLSGQTLSFQLNTTMMQTGVAHTLYVTAKIKGAIYTSNTITFTVGNVVAASISQNITGGSTLPASKTWTATLTGITTTQAVLFAVDGNAKTTDATSPYTYVLDTTTIPDGSHEFYVGVTDVNGKDFTNKVIATVSNVVAAAPVNTAVPTISPPTYQQGTTLTANDGTWTGTPTPVIARQWYHCDAAGANCNPIVGYTAPTYTLVAADVGGTVKVRVKGTNASAPSGVTADSAVTSVIQPTGGGGGGPPTGFHWYETWESGVVPANWLTAFYDPSNSTYAFVTDPLGVNGKVLRFRCVNNPAFTTTYQNGDRQLVSLWRTAANAHSGYNTTGEETWYRTRVMFPSGCVFSSGDTNYLQEWHTDDNTQALGGNSSGIYVSGGFPLLPGGTTNPKIALIWRSGSPSSPTETYWPSTGTGAYNSLAGITPVYDHWYEMLFRVIWSTSPTIGRLEWYVDGVAKVSRSMATLYTNPNLPGGAAYNSYGLYYYRYNITGTSTAYFDVCAAGPTRASVGA